MSNKGFFYRGKYWTKNTNDLILAERTVGQKAADLIAAAIGSWAFIIIQSCLIVVWMVLNTVGFIRHWDTYPFILLNLGLSMQAALTAPIIMMSQNRQTEKDRIENRNDYEVNLRAEAEIMRVSQLINENLQQTRAMQAVIEHLQAHLVARSEIPYELDLDKGALVGAGD